MSLLTGKETVTIQNRTPTKTAHGTTYTNTGDPISVRCDVRMLSTTETAQLGLLDHTVIRILARTWPGDSRSVLTWRNKQWEPQGHSLERTGSAKTRHIEITAVSHGA